MGIDQSVLSGDGHGDLVGQDPPVLLDPVALALVLARSPQGGQGLDVLGVGGSSEGGRLGPLRGQRPRGQREVDAWDAVVVDAIDAAVFLAVGCEFGGEEAAVVGGWVSSRGGRGW